jgi:hypothetical protein
MATKVFLDAETLPPEKDDPLIRDRVADWTEEEFRQLALNAQYGRLLCIGVIIEKNNRIVRRGVLGRDKQTLQFHLDEERTLRSFWKLLGGFNIQQDLLIGFNLLDFDLHFICTRSVIKQVKPSFEVCFARFRQQPVFDCMWSFTHWRYRIKLDELAKVLGLESPKQNGMSGDKVYDLFLERRHQEICDYVMRDCTCTRAIYYRLNFLEEADQIREQPNNGLAE